MDEIIIEEKKYISSKRAAKITGYAKDYIGQLCREGRVPARLVGRGWYVLETAIQDHRFGTVNTQSEEIIRPTPPVLETSQESELQNEGAISPDPEPLSKWESPRYEPTAEEFLPSVNRLRQNTSDTQAQESIEESNATDHLADSWRAWFDHIADIETVVPVAKNADIEKNEYTNEDKPIEYTKIDEDNGTEDKEEVSVPIHTIYELPPESSIPDSHFEVRSPNEEISTSRQTKSRTKKVTARTVQIMSILFATIAAAAAVAGSGYLDTYIISSSQVRILTGSSVYTK